MMRRFQVGSLNIKAVAWEGYQVNGVTLQQCGTGDAAGENEKNETVNSVKKLNSQVSLSRSLVRLSLFFTDNGVNRG